MLNMLLFLLIAVGGGLSATWIMIERGSALTTEINGPWTHWTAAGRLDADPYTRAHFARHALLPVSTALIGSYQATLDSEGRPLHSSCEYVLEGPEPSRGWWSLAVFDAGGKLIRNDAGRHSFSSDTAMRAPSGRVAIHLARSARPGNWLPTGGAGRLVLVLQVEDPHDAAMGGAANSGDEPNVQLPSVRRIAC
ncbi:DUF1214 domain-containing protein [Hyphomicrobium sp. CS1BSMeth3]|uniref:DUF1214 domain-containing protein n=1 Tax=Hyphomicrobium sp. CS1BSMeth3 TaxID=1892844 RepID=UPI000930E9EE|nr:DUF1214 domain-containing protein [Hyphomicrobium sp. CS1BSMeth3]